MDAEYLENIRKQPFHFLVILFILLFIFVYFIIRYNLAGESYNYAIAISIVFASVVSGFCEIIKHKITKKKKAAELKKEYESLDKGELSALLEFVNTYGNQRVDNYQSSLYPKLRKKTIIRYRFLGTPFDGRKHIYTLTEKGNNLMQYHKNLSPK
jgi:hypothetical protein